MSVRGRGGGGDNDGICALTLEGRDEGLVVPGQLARWPPDDREGRELGGPYLGKEQGVE